MVNAAIQDVRGNGTVHRPASMSLQTQAGGSATPAHTLQRADAGSAPPTQTNMLREQTYGMGRMLSLPLEEL